MRAQIDTFFYEIISKIQQETVIVVTEFLSSLWDNVALPLLLQDPLTM